MCHDVDLTLFCDGEIRSVFLRRCGVFFCLIQALLLDLSLCSPIALPDHELVVQLGSDIFPDSVAIQMDGLQGERLEEGRADVEDSLTKVQS